MFFKWAVPYKWGAHEQPIKLITSKNNNHTRSHQHRALRDLWVSFIRFIWQQNKYCSFTHTHQRMFRKKRNKRPNNNQQFFIVRFSFCVFRWFTCANVIFNQNFVLCGLSTCRTESEWHYCALFCDLCCFRFSVMIYSSPTSPPSPLYLLRPTQTNPSEEQMSLSLLCFINFSLEHSHFVALVCLLTKSGVRSLLFWLCDSLRFQLCLVKLSCDSRPLCLNYKSFVLFFVTFLHDILFI